MQNTYILLRNNVESLPLGLEDLKKIGLLPTDLLWVECQSVSWRHPQEITELKSLLSETSIPQTREHNDILFEKYSPKVDSSSAGSTIKNETGTTNPSKGNYLKKNGETVPAEKESSLAVNNNSSDKGQSNISANHGRTEVFIDTSADNDSTKVYFPKPVQQDKAAFIESLLAIPRKKIALYAGLIAGGAIMMLIIMGTGGNDKAVVQPAAPKQEALNTTPAEEPAAPSEDTTTSIPESYKQENIPIAEAIVTPVPEQKTSLPPKPAAPAKKTEEKKAGNIPASEPAVAKSPVVNEPVIEKKVPVASINSQLLIKTNEYNVAAFGGIRNLLLTLQNNSGSFPDKVSVEVRYLNPEGEIVKKDIIDFKFVKPGEASTVAVKKSSRGVKVSYKVISVHTKELAAGNAAAAESPE
jgi:hypothetical protein